jgi:hypothetical protein
MARTKEFKEWHKIECARRLGQLEQIEEILDKQMILSNLKIEEV